MRAADRVVRWFVLLAGAAAGTLAAPAFAATQTAPGAPMGNVTPVVSTPRGHVAAGAVGAAVDDVVAVLIQNGSAKTARVDLVSATATTSDGGTVTRARSVRAFPQVLAPGELALASVKFRGNGVPPGATILVKVRSTPVNASKAARALAVSNLALSAPRTGAPAQTLDATVTNPTTNWTARMPSVAVMCFGEARQPVTLTTARAAVDRVAPQRQTTVSVPLTTLCPTYLVAASST